MAAIDDAGVGQGSLAIVVLQLYKEFAAVRIDDVKPDRPGRPLGFASFINGSVRAPRNNLDIVNRLEHPEVANPELISSIRHSDAPDFRPAGA
jgi:hypothetical protein